ncbi:MAG TPA: YdeI/OmpD-associated family protein [Cyclobacteriaceae bacterium]|nr:YdeI/OmpD-associated family protein [Cyclobacteriaceae bacterium]
MALKTFTNFSYSNRKEYVEWITDAKTETTRERRITTAIGWLAEGKVRNWKYLKK